MFLNKLLDRPITVTMAMLVVITLGITAIRSLPISLIPDVDIPYITVQVVDRNKSAQELDESVLKPLRQQLIQISSIEDIRSEAKDGSGTIRLVFEQGADMDYLFIEVNEKIDRSMPNLGNIERPKVLKSGATDIPAFYINMTLRDSTVSSSRFLELSSFASEVVARRIEQLPEVAMVDISGLMEPEIMIAPDMDELSRLNVTLEQFENAVSSSNIRLGNLSIRDGEYQYNVRFRSFISGKEDIENIYLNISGRLLQLKDLASVTEQPAKRTGLVRSDGMPAVTMAVIKQSEAKMASLKKDINRLMSYFSEDYPEIDFRVTRDQTELLDYSINNLINNIVVGILLACLIVVFFMRDFKSPVLVILTIPTALIFSMLVFHIIGLTINIISLSGLVLGVGMMMDNTIILIDNITARWQRGDALRKAVVKGTSEVIVPMLSSVLTTCAVFIPLIFVSGIAGAIFYDQAMAVTIVLLTSYFVTITIIPVYYWVWYRKSESFKPNRWLERFSFNGVIRIYESSLRWLFRHRWVGWAFFGLSFFGIVICFLFMEKEKLPEITYTDTLLKIDWNASLSLEQNEERIAALEDAISGTVSHVTSMVGAQQFVLGHSGDQSVSEALLYVKCDAPDDLLEVEHLVALMMSEDFPDASYGFEPSGNIFDMVFSDKEARLTARLRPVSSPEIEPELIEGVVAEIAAAFDGLYIPSPPMKEDLLYIADPEKMALYDIGYSELVSVLKNSLNENRLFEIVQGERSVPVVMGTGREDDITETIARANIKKNGTDIPVRSLLSQTYEMELKSLVSGAEGNYYPVDMNPKDSDVKETMAEVSRIVSQDGNFEVGFSGSYFSNRKMIGELVLVLVIALVLLYLILASQFESLLQPLIIMSEIVIDIFGALAVLWLLDVSINLMSMIGLVVICGIVINDSILKIDTINKLRKEGFALKHAVMEAGQRRLKAIIMTSLTTILAVCPFLTRGNMGDDLQYPMSLVIIAGMIVGTTVSLLFVPMVYYEIYKKQE